MIKAFLFLSLVFIASAQFGKCPQFTTQPDFKLESYLGRWYQIARLNAPFEKGGVCSVAEYYLNQTRPGHVVVNNTERLNSPSGRVEGAIGDAYVADPKNPAKLSVNFPNNPVTAPYWVMETDYKQYTAVVSCFEVLGVYHSLSSWILSRTPTLNATLLDDLLVRLKKNNIPVDKYEMTLQQGCW
jgi:apolipoprotein D and lipocalin family protein